jgi:hypothetical protein
MLIKLFFFVWYGLYILFIHNIYIFPYFSIFSAYLNAYMNVLKIITYNKFFWTISYESLL